jgi:DNA polymerase-3 subunit gamma/tau
MQVLYRKYRSKNFDELLGQDHIIAGLKKAIAAQNPAHAYLLTGPRGTGKTSIARIIAHNVNKFDYDDPCRHIDIIEIDAASNRRIDEIRDLRERVTIAPMEGKYKVYIIDEVHMLTREAFNALLKTLEEPPAHVIFILATTDLHKVPDTIISRTQRYTLRPLSEDDIVRHLRHIADKEDIAVDDAALRAIAKHSEGGFRDAISLLDQTRHLAQPLTLEAVHTALGLPPADVVSMLYGALTGADDSATEQLSALLSQGYHAPLIAEVLLKHSLEQRNVALARQLLAVASSNHAETELLLLAVEADADISTRRPSGSSSTPSTSTALDAHATTKASTPSPEAVRQAPAIPPSGQPEVTDTATTEPTTPAEWKNVLAAIQKEGHAVYGPLRLAEVNLQDNVLHLGLKFPFHIKKITEPDNLRVIAAHVKQFFGDSVGIEVGKGSALQSEPDGDMPPPIEPTDSKSMMLDPLSLVKNVFGSAEEL